MAVFIPGAAGQSATGLKVQRGKLYAAGAATGTIKVYDVDSGELLATFDTKGGDSSPTFVNDLDVTKRGDVYATDSKRQAIYHLTAEEIAAGTPAAQADRSRRRHLDVARDPLQRGAHGVQPQRHRGRRAMTIITVGDRRRGDELIVVNSDTGQLFRVKVRKGDNAARRIRELEVKGGPFKGGDGLLVDRGRLIVVQGSTATASPTAWSTSSSCATTGATAGSRTSAPTPRSRGRRPSRAPATSTWWSTRTSPPARRRSR